MTDTNELWDQLFMESAQVITWYLRNSKKGDQDALSKVKVATSTLSSCTRHEQTQSARDATRVVVARHLADGPEQFKQYLVGGIPELPSTVGSP